MERNSGEQQDRSAVDVALLVARVIVGIIFVAHGSQKLFGTFGGPGLAGSSAGRGRVRSGACPGPLLPARRP